MGRDCPGDREWSLLLGQGEPQAGLSFSSQRVGMALAGSGPLCTAGPNLVVEATAAFLAV